MPDAKHTHSERRAVIMAGGEGTRLRPFTQTIPKPLLPLGRKPIAQIIVERLRDCGITEITMTLGYAAELIRAFFQTGSQFGVRVSYFQEPSRMGTAGCLAHIPELRVAPFLVSNGDILTDLDYCAFLQEHEASDAVLSVATRSENVAIPYGVLRLDGARVLGVEEKPCMNYCFNAGIYAVSTTCLGLIPTDRPFDMTDLINALLAAGHAVRSVPLEGLWFDLARVDDFEKALAQIEKTHPHLL
ncbi:MAG: sugar phosphate nucleotidyltransferase [Candidatus Sumerlaeaceae bacterium]